MFSSHDASWLSQTVGAFYSARTSSELARVAIELYHPHFRALAVAVEEFSQDATHYVAHGLRSDSPPPPDYAAYLHDNPLLAAFSVPVQPNLLQLRRIISLSDWEKTDHFNGIARRVGYNDQLAMVARRSGLYFGVGLFRDRAFNESEYQLAQLLQPHWQVAFLRTRPATLYDQPLPFWRTPLSSSVTAPTLTATQRSILASYFPRWRQGPALPSELRDWIDRSLVSLRELRPNPLRAFVANSARGRLLVRCFPERFSDHVYIHFVEVPALPKFLDLRHRGLTTRECEVLHWLAQGKRDAEIAAILGIATRTAGKHVEHLLKKLGAETRTGAVRVAHSWL